VIAARRTVECREFGVSFAASSSLEASSDESVHTATGSVRVRVRVSLQLTVSQLVRLGVEPDLGLLTRDNFFFFFLSYGLVIGGRPL
jgi:hypothetical protein